MNYVHLITEIEQKMTAIKYLRNLSFIAIIIPSEARK
jgi:hypothetical protein